MTFQGFAASTIASLLDPLLVAIVLVIAAGLVFSGSRPVVAILAATVLGVAVGTIMAQSLAQMRRTTPSTLADSNFDTWKSIAHTEYEENWDFFIGVRSAEAAEKMKQRIDDQKRACALLVGHGPNLILRCERQSTLAKAMAGGLLGMSFGALAVLSRRNRGSKPAPAKTSTKE